MNLHTLERKEARLYAVGSQLNSVHAPGVRFFRKWTTEVSCTLRKHINRPIPVRLRYSDLRKYQDRQIKNFLLTGLGKITRNRFVEWSLVERETLIGNPLDKHSGEFGQYLALWKNFVFTIQTQRHWVQYYPEKAIFHFDQKAPVLWPDMDKDIISNSELNGLPSSVFGLNFLVIPIYVAGPVHPAINLTNHLTDNLLWYGEQMGANLLHFWCNTPPVRAKTQGSSTKQGACFCGLLFLAKTTCLSTGVSLQDEGSWFKSFSAIYQAAIW